ncbi:hypothetical protein lbkm_2570 [Lachnospiraceae bacterium KM106-2]|nr:hypothetical protein lbkm_2570 [Lachnospiraceae bacterium KM106-2]
MTDSEGIPSLLPHPKIIFVSTTPPTVRTLPFASNVDCLLPADLIFFFHDICRSEV